MVFLNAINVNIMYWTMDDVTTCQALCSVTFQRRFTISSRDDAHDSFLVGMMCIYYGQIVGRFGKYFT